MKRIERVFEYLQEVAKSQDGEKALTATAIADNLGILRSNVSRELNKLYRMGKIMKISGRPVLYKINDENKDMCCKKKCMLTRSAVRWVHGHRIHKSKRTRPDCHPPTNEKRTKQTYARGRALELA